jgi:thioredoxin reductase
MAHSAGHVYVIASQSDRLVTPLARALRRYPNVTFLEDVVVREVRGAANVEAIVLEQHSEERVIAVDAVFADVGLVPHSDMVLHLLQTAPGGFIWVNDHNATTLPGLFAAGDVTTVFVEQVLIAIGEGARAAASAYEYILSTLTPPVERSVGRAPDAGWY